MLIILLITPRLSKVFILLFYNTSLKLYDHDHELYMLDYWSTEAIDKTVRDAQIKQLATKSTGSKPFAVPSSPPATNPTTWLDVRMLITINNVCRF